jgi:hypothetical protein
LKTREAEAKQFKLDGDYQDAIDVLSEAVDLIAQSGWQERVDAVETLEPSDEKWADQVLRIPLAGVAMEAATYFDLDQRAAAGARR